MKNTWIWVIVIILLIAGGWYYQSNKPAPAAGEPIKIGALLQLTGNTAQYGELSKMGIDLAQSYVNSHGGVAGRPIEVVYEDTQNQPQLALSGLEKLKTVDNGKYFLSQGSSVVMAIGPVANSSQIILMDVGSTVPGYRTPNDFTFRVSVTALQLARGEADFVINKYKKPALFYTNDDYGQGMKSVIEQILQANNTPLVGVESFISGSTDYRSQLLKLKNQNPDILLVVSRLKETPIILKQIKDIGLQVQVLSDVYGVESQDVIDQAGDTAEGVLYIAPKFDRSIGSATSNFINEFTDQYDKEPTQLSAQGYDGVMVLVAAIKKCRDLDTTCVKDELSKVKMPGASGYIQFDETGDVLNRDTIIKTVKNGEFVKVEE